MLGDSARTYTISEVRSPRSMGVKSAWLGTGGIEGSFSQKTLTAADATTWKGLIAKVISFRTSLCNVFCLFFPFRNISF